MSIAGLDISLKTGTARYAELRAKHTEVAGIMSAANEKRLALGRAARAAAGTSAPPPPKSALSNRVAALLGNVAPPDPGPTDRERVSAEMIEAEEEWKAATQALEVVADELRNERMAASVVVCDRIRPEFSKRVAAVCDAMVELARTLGEYHELTDALNAEDVAWSLLDPVHHDRMEDPRDPHCMMRQYVEKAVKAGHYPASRLPKSWR